MKNLIVILFSVFLISVGGCFDSKEEKAVKQEIKIDYTLTSIAKKLIPVKRDMQVIQGEIVATNIRTNEIETFLWFGEIDEEAFTIVSNSTLILNQADYNIQLEFTYANHKYMGHTILENVEEKNTINLIVHPIIGDTKTAINITEIPSLKLSYPPGEMKALTNPSMGIIIDEESELILAVNPALGVSDGYINITQGQHIIKLKLYDAEFQVGKSLKSQENVNVGVENIQMDIEPLYGEMTFNLGLDGGDARFEIVVPQEVIEEVDGINNVRAVVKVLSGINGLAEQEMSLTLLENESYIGELVLNNYKYDNLTLTIEFYDKRDNNDIDGKIGISVLENIEITKDEQTVLMNMNIRRRGVITGNLLGMVGLNVFDADGLPISGAGVYIDDELVGITGSSAFGTLGYLKVYAQKGNHIICAKNTFVEKESEDLTIDVNSLEIENYNLYCSMDMNVLAIPVNIVVVAVATNKIEITWDASTDDNVIGYKIYRDNIEIATTSNLNYSDTGLASSRTYSYSLSAIDAEGNESLLSTVVSATTPSGGISTGGEIGMNLGSIVDYSAAWTFVDRMKNARSWISYDENGAWDSGVEIPCDENGYPLQIPFGSPAQSVRTLLFRGFDSYPAGTYTLIFEGEGTISLNFAAKGEYTEPNVAHHFEITSPITGGLLLSITRSSVDNPIRNIRVIMPGFEDNYQEQIFHPLFLERLQDFKVLRFMDWGKTNNSETIEWSKRTTPQRFSQAGGYSGVALEYMIELSNQLDIDPWFCIPHQANDDYIRNMAQLIDQNLEQSKKIYIEYSNELWNYQFLQARYAGEMGIDQGLGDGDGFLANLHYNARRSAQIFQIFEEYFDSDHLVRVVASQAGNSWTGKKILEGLNDSTVNPTSSRADALAIAPYFGGSVGNDIVSNNEVDSISIDEILNRAEASVYSKTAVWTAKNKVVTDTFDVKLIAYEGGQHLVGTGGNENNETLTNKLIEANRNPRMKDIYLNMFDVWFQNGGTLFSAFSNICIPTKWGSWGMLEYQNQPIEDAPKYEAIKEALLNN